MTISQIARTVKDQRQAHLIRYRTDSVKECGTAQYDAKPYGTGSKRGWTLIDLTTASAIVAVHDALTKSQKPENLAKFDNIPLGRLVDFCWKHVR